MLNKDAEGIKYIVEKDGREFLLKLFYRASLSNITNIFNLQQRLQQLNKLEDKHLPKVVEIDPHFDPPYMIVEFMHGVSLADLKAHNPQKLTEDFIRLIATQIVNTAITLHQYQLTLKHLALSNIMINDNDEVIILSSAITWEERDEREEMFFIAVVLAQALSQHDFYKTLYSQERLSTQKFEFINGVSVPLNKILAECLHRNILQRYRNLNELLNTLVNLPPTSECEIWTEQETTIPDKLEDLSKKEIPKIRIEVTFWVLLILIIAIVVMLLTTNIFSVLFGGRGKKLTYSAWLMPNSESDTINATVPQSDLQREKPTQTTYGELKSGTTTAREDFRKQLPVPKITTVTPPPVAAKPRPPQNMIFIAANTMGFGRLRENPNSNVSLSSYYISKFEVTQAEWNAYMKPANCSTFGENLPVDNISWFDIAIYCNGRSETEGLTPAYKIRGVGASRVVTCDFKANGYRLPTEAEWEMAAKAGKLYNYSGSDDPDEISWNRENSGGKIHTPGTKKPNDYGIYDMTGNVSEWVWDWYDVNYIRSLPTFINPTGPDTGTLKAIRGGSVMNGEGRNLNIMWREKGDPNRGYQYVGFRLVRSN
ncbi:MAG TPA: SUMF1/EgtB/PvdO family nonheme iron enzyme [Candidatus Cloacimonas sp.]|nr:SUMF1/EgtB/PvdO family nonheme iron enzyme [Candidatus Cloacimonas sp.]